MDEEKCHICGTARKRNLIIDYIKKKSQTVGEFLFDVTSGDKHVICYRCQSLNLSKDDKKYMMDRYFPVDKRQYKNQEQKVAANRYKREQER